MLSRDETETHAPGKTYFVHKCILNVAFLPIFVKFISCQVCLFDNYKFNSLLLTHSNTMTPFDARGKQAF